MRGHPWGPVGTVKPAVFVVAEGIGVPTGRGDLCRNHDKCVGAQDVLP